MAPNDSGIIDGTKPSEGGEIEINHHVAQPQPGQVIQPQQDTGLKPFKDNLASSIDDPNNYIQDKSEVINEQPSEGQLPQPVMQPTGSQNSIEQLPPIITPPSPIDSGAERIPEPDINSVYGDNSMPANQAFTNYNQTHPTINTPVNVNLTPLSQDYNRFHPAQRPPVMQADVNPFGANIPYPQNYPYGPKRRFNLKKTLLFGMPIFVVMSGLVYALAFYIPNTPQNVWNTSLDRTGQQLDALVQKLSQKDAFAAYEKTKVKVQGSLDTNGQKYQINMDSNYDSTSSDTKAAIQADDDTLGGPTQIEALIKTSLPEGADFPNVYFNVSGIKDLGLDAVFGGISAYDGKWIAVEQDYINSLFDKKAPTEQDQNSPVYDDVASIANDINSVTQQYLFSNDQESSILVLKEFIGTDQSEGIIANHYKAGINGQNLQNWCNALIDKLANNQTFKDLNGITEESLPAEVENQKKQCQEIDKNIKADDNFDIWMDKKHKIIHKIRVYNESSESYIQQLNQAEQQANYDECLTNNNGYEEACVGILNANVDTEQSLGTEYYELGQVYKAKNQVMLFYNQKIETSDENINSRLELTINTDNLAFSGKIAIQSRTLNDDNKLDITISTEPYQGNIDSSKPDGAIPVQEFLKTIFGTDNPYVEVQSSTRDSERKSDINVLHTMLEAYYVDYVTYPSFNQINDQEFRNNYLRGFLDESFSDPESPNSYLSGLIGVNTYSYVVTPSGCDGVSIMCDYYELSATLEDGSLYTKKSLSEY